MPEDPAPTRQETVAAFLAVAARRSAAVPLRTTFVQQGERAKPSPGPLQIFVRSHDESALDLFLLHRARASTAPWDVAVDARVWARALGLATPRDSGAAAVSKLWTRLDGKYGLVTRERSGRLLRVSSLREDGSRRAYEYPAGHRSGERYLKLPFAYWIDDWYRTLGLPAKAMLLIALSLKSPFVLPTERMPAWYGISADTAERGLRRLRESGLLDRTRRRKAAPLAPTGFTLESRYSLRPPFDRPQRNTGRPLLSLVTEAS